MAGLWKNQEFRSDVLRLGLFMAAAAAVLLLLCLAQMRWAQGRTADQLASAVGVIAEKYPDIREEFAAALINPASKAQVSAGRALLGAYGLGGGTALSLDPVLGGALGSTLLGAAGFAALCAAGVLAITAAGYRKVYRRVAGIAEAAEKVVDGDFDVLLPAVGEGAFEILGHRFNQMANRLKRNVAQLTAEKVFLRNTISDISHQLKTPLATLVVYNDLMSEQPDMEAGRRAEFLGLSRRQLQRLEWLIQSLLKMARLEAGSIAFMKRPVNLRAVAEAAAAAVRVSAGEAGVSVIIEEHHAGASVTGDEEWLAEAAINIVKNAVEHSRPGGTVTVAVDHTPLTASVTVTDRGCGIEAADLPHIFERFYRSAHSVKPDSIGIGLAMAKAIVEGQGGTLSVRSERGRGSEFSIEFLKTLGV